uniref:C2H2-type domain-containing protein n=1 Tax=Graphocephala atropunctata TaxID=36148 RepID=A0A1B6M801_9HEMI
MCETMATIPVEETSYMLTEDMFDAAMTEQFAYQDDIESEEDCSSQDEVMEVDRSIQCESIVENGEDARNANVHQLENIPVDPVVMNPGTSGYNDSAMSVVVIETGLNQTNKQDIEPPTTNTTSEVATEKEAQLINKPVNSVESKSNEAVDIRDIHQEPHSDSSKSTVQTSKEVTDKSLPLLKKILSDKPADVNIGLIESIDLCDSENDRVSDDDVSDGEQIDDELKSMIKSNLMAEVGFTLNRPKEPDSNSDQNKQVVSSPKIAVKSITQISTDAFNNLPNNIKPNEIINREHIPPIQKTNSDTSSKINVSANNISSDISTREINQVPTTIQISKIAVPHHTFVNSKGQKMNCVYVRNQTALPVVINSNQPRNKNVRLMLTSQVKNGPVQLASITALSNVTKVNLQNKPVLSKPSKILATAPKLQRPPILQGNPTIPHQFIPDPSMESIVRTLLFQNLKKPYLPPQVPQVNEVTHHCPDCNDRFLLKSSLMHHLARCSVHIRYWCRICKTEIQFYNKCIFFKHLRCHRISVKNVDTTCITFSPIGKEMIENGVASSCFSESLNEVSNDSILLRNVKNGQQNENLPKTVGVEKVPNESRPMSSVTTNVAGQSKGICLPGQSSIILNKPIGALAPISQATKPMFTAIVPKTSKFSGKILQPLKRQNTDKPAFLNKAGPKSVILLCNKLPKPATPKQYGNKLINSILHNVEEPESRMADHKSDTINNDIQEDIDIESVTIENDFSTMDSIKNVGSEKSARNINKDKKLLSSSQKSIKRNCSECGGSCLNISKHLNGNNRPINSDLTCESCHLIMATKCALKIHLRIHMKMAPYKCPDCGKEFESWDEVHAHLKFSCGHLAKCVRYMCVSCKAHFPSVAVLGHHISSSHARDIFKCKLCPVAFFNSPSLDKHMQTNHPNETDLGMDYKQCSLCPKKLVPMDKFVEHVQEHTRHPSAMIYGYKCPMCSVVFANKMAFIIHQLKEKKDKEQKERKATRTNKAMQSKNLSDSNSELEDEPEIIRKYPEMNDNSSAAEKDPLSLEDWDCLQEFTVKEKREELCIVCKKNSVILLPNIDLNDQSLCCKQCVKPLDIDSAINSSSSPTNNRHMSKTHASNSAKNHIFNPIKRKRSVPKTIKRSSSCDEAKKSRLSVDNSSKDHTFGSEGSGELCSEFSPVKKKSRKKPNREKFDQVDQTHIQGQVITSKSQDELVCSKCEFVADVRETFLKHIIIHRTDPNTFQCLECGLCFVVLPSLERHLQMHHGIKDVSSYTKKNSSSLPQKIASVMEDTEDNKCRVCNEMFDSGLSLEKHFRTHGMAFMNSLSKSP